MSRSARCNRTTKETEIQVYLKLEGKGKATIKTPVGFFNHMLESFSKHGLFDLNVKAQGDLQVDQHHLIEDCGIVLGQAFSKALGDRKGINRAGYFVFPMDEALSLAAVDIGGRPFLQYEGSFKRRFCGAMDIDLVEDFFQAFAANLKANIAIRILSGRSDHHKMEAMFKAFGKAMRMACSLDSREEEAIPSIKGVIDDDRNH